MTGKDALKACPFCGSNEVAPYRPAMSQTWAVVCESCDARSAVATSRELSIRLWNTRSSGWEDERAELVEALEDLTDAVRFDVQKVARLERAEALVTKFKPLPSLAGEGE